MDKKTKDYTRAAIDRYNSKFDRVSCNLPKGSRDRIAAVAPQLTPGAFVREAALEKLAQLENMSAADSAQAAQDNNTRSDQENTAGS